MTIEQLEETKKSFVDCNGRESMTEEDALNIGLFMLYTLEILKSQQTRITDLQAEVKVLVKVLEQEDSDYPTKEEIPNIKVGGTD